MKTRATFALAACLLALSARADDWPQYRGPNRDGVSKEKGLLKTWPAAGPKLLWTYKDAGNGYSTPAIVGNTLYVLGARGADEYLIALDLTKNPPTEKWPALKIGDTFTWKGNQWNKGPSATPTVVGDLIFAQGAQGDLLCATTAGKEKWRKSLPKDLGGQVNPIGGGPPNVGWGYAGSPLVDGDNLICVPGGPQGMVAALNKTTGEVVWRSKELKEQATYSSPVVSGAGGVRQYVVMTQKGAAGVKTDGSVLWNYARAAPFGDIVAPTPVVKDDLVFITAAPNGGRDLLKLTNTAGKFTATAIVSDSMVENPHGGVILVEGHVYGCSGERRTKWFCMDIKTGKIEWDAPGGKFGKGSLVYADGHFYCLGDKGLVALVDASPTVKFKVVSSFTLPDESKIRPPRGGVWTHPAIADGKLYLRDQELLFCYEVK